MDHHSLKNDLRQILNIARYAPSVHNTQPWLVRLMSENDLEISLDPANTLSDGDPTGRQSIISLGIFTEAVCLVARKFDWSADNVTFKDHSAIITFKSYVDHLDADVNKLLQGRCSDRSIFKFIQIDSEEFATIRDSASTGLPDIKIETVTTKSIMDKVAILTNRAISVALSSPGFRRELTEHLVLPGSKNRRGISVFSLYIPMPLALLEPLILRLGIGIKKEGRLELKRWQSASALIFITAKGDMPDYWFRAGRAYLRASLAIERLGFSQATSAAIVEASNYHEDIEAMLQTKQRILAVMRIGKGSKSRHYSPRVGVDELLH